MNGLVAGTRFDEDVQIMTRTDVAAVLRGAAPAIAGQSAQPRTSIAASANLVPQTRNALTFYPGSTRAPEAALVAMAAGEERTGVDFAVQTVSVTAVHVKLVQPGGGPAPISTRVNLFAAGGDATGRSDMETAQLKEDGTFSFNGVPPGDYVVGAQALMSSGGPLSATSPLTVDGHDVHDVVLTLEPGVTVSGRVQFEDASPEPRLLGTLRIGLSAVVSNSEVNMGVGPVSIDDAGRFSVVGVPPGRYLVEFTSADETGSEWRGWWLKSAVVNGHDAAEVPIEIPRAGIPDVAVTMSHRPSELSGTLLTPAGEPSSAHWIVVYSTDRAYWAPRSRRIMAIRPTDGRFTIGNLPPGDYFVAAVPDVEPGQWFDPAFLQALAATAPMRITISDGEKKTLDLRIH